MDIYTQEYGNAEQTPFKARKAVFEKLEKIVDIASLSKEERMKYDESIKVYRDNLATISFAKNQGKEEGLKEGIEKGLERRKKRRAQRRHSFRSPQFKVRWNVR